MVQTGAECSTGSNAQRRSHSVAALTAAVLALLEDKPLEELTIGQIVRAAGVSRNSFYRNFESKEQILKRYAEYLLADWVREAAADVRAVGLPLYRQLFTIIDGNRSFFTLLYRRGHLHLLLEVLEEGLPVPVDFELVERYTHAFFVHGLYGWVQEWVRRGFTESAEQMVQILLAGGYRDA